MTILVLCVAFLFVSCQKKESPPKEDKSEIQIVSGVQSEETEFYNTGYRHYGDFRVESQVGVSIMASSGFAAYTAKAWKKGIVPVSFEPTITTDRQALFFRACQVWGDVAQVQCRFKTTSDRHFVHVTDEKTGECWTELGQGIAAGPRVFNFGQDWCWGDVSLIHEIGHVLGLMHEHQRPDRDKFVSVHPENAGPFSFAYDILSVGALDNKGPYDFMSIMHYWNGAYSINGKPILVPKKGYEKFAQVMGRSQTLTEGDKTLIRSIYGPR